MAIRTLLQLYTVSIIFTKQSETRTLNETSNFAKNQTYSVDNTLVDKHFNKTDVSDRNGAVPMKGIYYAQQRVYTSPESKPGIGNRHITEQILNEENDVENLKTEQPSSLKSNTTLLPNELISVDNSNHFSNKEKYTEKDGRMNSINNDFLETLAIRTAIEKVKQELSETNDKQNDESLHNSAKEHLTHTKPVSRHQYSSRKHTRTTQSMTETLLITEVYNGIRKTEHEDKRNHKPPHKRENGIYELQRPNEFKIKSKHGYKLKHIANKSRDAVSLENEQYELKHVDDMAKMWASTQINLEYTPKYKPKKKHPSDKSIHRLKYLTARHNTNTRTTQSMIEISLIADVNNGIHGKIEHSENRNHKTPKTPENDFYRLQSSNEFKIVSKHDNKLKYIYNKTRDALSLENEQYEIKHVDDMAKVWASKQINLEYTPKYKQKKKYLTDKAAQRLKYLTSKHNTNIRTTQSKTENSLIAEVENSIRKIEYKENRNHKSPHKRENDIFKLQYYNEFKIASKHDNKSHDELSLEKEQYELKHVDDTAEVWVSKQINLKYTPKYKQKRHHNTNTHKTQSMTKNSLITEVNSVLGNKEHREIRNHKNPKKQESDIFKLQYSNEFKIASKHDNELKYIDNKSHDASLENQQHELKHVDDKAEVWASKQINLKYTPKYKRNVQKRKHHDHKDKHSDKTKQNSKIKHDLETYQDKYKLAVKKRDEGERIHDSGDTLNPDEGGTQTLEKHVAESHKTLKRENKGSKSKLRHNKKSNTKSLENEIYTLDNPINNFQKYEVEVPKQVPKLSKPKFSQNYQKKKYDKIDNTNKHIGKPKNKSEKVISNKQNHKNKLYFIHKKHTNIKREDDRIFDSRDKKRDNIKVDKEDVRTVTEQVGRQADGQIDEEASLESCEEQFKQNKSFHLPFYISTTTRATKDKDLKHTKNKRETIKTLLDDLNTVLYEKKNRNNDALNQTINRFVSSKIFDLITDRVAGKMLKKFQKLREERNHKTKHQFKAKTEVKPNKVEQIDILFKKNGDMQVIMSRENLTEIETNKSGDIVETFYSFYL